MRYVLLALGAVKRSCESGMGVSINCMEKLAGNRTLVALAKTKLIKLVLLRAHFMNLSSSSNHMNTRS